MKMNGADGSGVAPNTQAVRTLPKRNPIADINTSRRNILIGDAGIAAAVGLPMAPLAAANKPASASASHGNNQKESST